MDDQLQVLLDHLEKVWRLLRTPIFQINNSHISLSSIFISIAAIALTVFIAKTVGRLLNRALEGKGVDSGVRDSIDKFTRYLIITLGVLLSLDNLGISINSLAAVGAVLMVGIGFGLQNIAQNFISGIIILIERPIKVGDIIRVGTASGRVLDIRVRSSVIQTRDDVTIILPNSKILSEEVISDSYSGHKIRQHVHVGVAYGSDVALVKKLLCQAAVSQKNVFQEPLPVAIFEEFGDSSLNFDLRFWCSDIWHMDQINSDIRTEIDRLFRENQVEIPFPQRDLHIRSGLLKPN